MPNAQVFARIEGFGECLIISVNAAGAFSLSKGPRPRGIDVVPVTCDVAAGSPQDFIITRATDNSHSTSNRKRAKDDTLALVPVCGRAEGFIGSININAATGAIAAGSRSTTVAALFP